MLGLDLEHLAIDGCTTKAPCGGEVAGLRTLANEVSAGLAVGEGETLGKLLYPLMGMRSAVSLRGGVRV